MQKQRHRWAPPPVDRSVQRLDSPPFQSFWMGGFEGADHLNSRGEPLDLVKVSGHLDHLEIDYAQMQAWHLTTVRESVGWRLSESNGLFDFSRARRFAQVARNHGIQILWTLMHYGTPPDVSLLDDSFCERFATFAAAAAATLGELSDEPPIYTPINEMSFLAWAASQTRLIHPYGPAVEKLDGATMADGFQIKCRLAKATLMAMEAIRQVDARARFMHVEPIVHVVAPEGRPDLQELAEEVRSYQWQTWDILSGRMMPELGGHPHAIDLIGVNHYHNGQWEVLTEKRLHWHLKDPRRRRFSSMLEEVWRRYHRPIVISETSHIGVGRAEWLDEMASEARLAVKHGVPVKGMCLYPIVDRPDWDDADHWHNSGLWDHAPEATGTPRWPRRIDLSYAKALHQWQSRMPRHS